VKTDFLNRRPECVGVQTQERRVGAPFAQPHGNIGLEFIERVQGMTDNRVIVRVGSRSGCGTLCNWTVLVTQDTKIGI
jgi:hypothetical protein